MVNYSIGASTKEQNTIQGKVDQEYINNLLSNNTELIRSYFSNVKDDFDKEFLNFFLSNLKIKFEINKHEEIYILFNQQDIIKVFKYLIFRNRFRQSGEKKISFKAPTYLLVEPVSTCNLRCPFCFQTDKSFTKKPYMGVMNFDLFKKIVDEADSLKIGAITIASRGEPTLHKNYKDMLKYIGEKENIFEVKTNTNATFLNEDNCHAILKNNISQVVISSDHYIKEEYEKLRLGANFEKIVENVDRLFNIRNTYYPNSITEIRISGIDNDRNLDRNLFHNFWIKRSDHVSASYPMERWNTYENNIHPEINDSCQYLWDRMYVWFDGKTNPCDADYKSYLSYGDVSKDTIENIWNNEKLKEIRRSHSNNERNKVDPCNKCGVTFI
jgi:radical SAM protein with 4Fe4S-binding SPASM domain